MPPCAPVDDERCEPFSLPLGDGRRLGGRRWRGRGTTLVLLHGLLDSAEGWDAVCRSSPRPAIALDLPGFGGSSLPRRPRISAYAEDVVLALEALRVRDCVLVGHSLGGAVAAAVAERMSARVAALVLLAPAGFGRIPLAEAISIPGVRNVTQLLLPFGLASRAGLRLAYTTVVSNGTAPEPGVLERVVTRADQLAPGAREATRAVVAAGLSERAFHRRRVEYDGPVTAVWGCRDRLVPPAHERGVRAALPQARCEVWRDMGHHPQHERRGELLALLARATAPRVSAPAPLRAAS